MKTVSVDQHRLDCCNNFQVLVNIKILNDRIIMINSLMSVIKLMVELKYNCSFSSKTSLLSFKIDLFHFYSLSIITKEKRAREHKLEGGEKHGRGWR